MRRMTFATLFKISRPRFWIYLVGPYLIGLAAAANTKADIVTLENLIWAIFWLFPANLLVYGINDIHDYATDRRNPKKRDYEQLVTPSMFPSLRRHILFATVPFFPMLFVSGRTAVATLYAFLALAYFYSAPPVRAKAKPVLDSLFNVLYILPGLFGYFLLGGDDLALRAVAASAAWCLAMHAFSAVPDISSDRRAKVETIGTTLGFYGTLITSLVFFIISAELAKPYLGWVAVAAGDIYSLLIIGAIFMRTDTRVLALYKTFPYVNMLIGALIVAVVADQSFGSGALDWLRVIRL